MKELKLQTKLFIVYALIVSLILGSTLIFFYTYSSQNLKNRYIENLSQLSIKSTQQIDSMIREMNQISLYAATNPTIRSYFLSKQATPTHELNFEQSTLINETLMAIALPANTPYLRTSLYDDAQNYISLGIPDNQKTIDLRLNSATFQAWYTEMKSQKSKFLLTTPHTDSWNSQNTQPLFSFIRVMKDVTSYVDYGIVEVQMPYSVLEETLTLGQDQAIKILIYDQNGQLIFPLNMPDASTLIAFYTSLFSSTLPENKTLSNPLTHQKEITFYAYSERAKWSIVMTQETAQLLSPVFFMSKILLLTGICLMLVLLITVYFISQKMTEPLISLRNSVRSISLDNLSLSINDTSSLNEVKELESAFNKMFSQLKVSMDDVILAKTQEMNAHMIALQAQMDPHFLYNMLSIINAISREQENQEITEICNKLSGMLRYISVYNEESVPFQDELTHVENYLRLMAVRFEDQLHYTIQIDASFDQIQLKVPKLILQPLVENCFQHGFKKVAPPWVIHLHAYTDQDYWKVTIFDNGSGIGTEKIQEITHQVTQFLDDPSKNIKDLKLGGMGLVNILIRLKLYYHEDFIFDIEKGLYGSTQITIGGKFR